MMKPINRTTMQVAENQYRVFSKGGPVYYKNPDGKLNPIDLSFEDTSSKIGDISLMKRNIVSVGKRKGDNPYKVVGIRPDNNQSGEKQIEFSLINVELDGEKQDFNVENDLDIKATHSYVRQLVKTNKSFSDYKVEFDLHLTGVNIENKKYSKELDLFDHTYTLNNHGEGLGHRIFNDVYTNNYKKTSNSELPHIDINIGKITNDFYVFGGNDSEFKKHPTTSGMNMYDNGGSMYLNGCLVISAKMHNFDSGDPEEIMVNQFAKILGATIENDDGFGRYFIKNGKKVGGYYMYENVFLACINTKKIPDSIKDNFKFKDFNSTTYTLLKLDTLEEKINEVFLSIPKVLVDKDYYEPHENGSFEIKIKNESFYISLPVLFNDNGDMIDSATNHTLTKISDDLYRYTKYFSLTGVLSPNAIKYIDTNVNLSHDDLMVYRSIPAWGGSSSQVKTATNLTAMRHATSGTNGTNLNDNFMQVSAGDYGLKSSGKTTTYRWLIYQKHFAFDSSGVTDTITDAKLSLLGTYYIDPQTTDNCGNTVSTEYPNIPLRCLKSNHSTTAASSNWNAFVGHGNYWVALGSCTEYSDSYDFDAPNDTPSNSASTADGLRQDIPLNSAAKTDFKDDDTFKLALIDNDQYYGSLNSCYAKTATGTYYARIATNANAGANNRPYMIITTQAATTPEDNAIFFGTTF